MRYVSQIELYCNCYNFIIILYNRSFIIFWKYLVSFVYAQSTLSDYEFHGYLESMIGRLDPSIINVQSKIVY
jgi:hypothetical protein